MTSSDMQHTPAGRRAARADGPRSAQPKRRTFTAACKLAMIEKYDAATEPGTKGALLRGEGLYDSHISYWRKARSSGSLASSAAAADAVFIDEGVYLASVSTMYRLLREAGQVRERRAQAAHPARTKPELIADAPNEVWSWDITKLTGRRSRESAA